MDWKDTLYKAGIVVKESVVEFIERQCREEVDNATRRRYFACYYGIC